jgi:hypothetical protein
VPVVVEPSADLFARHQTFFELSEPLLALRPGVRRVVAACSFGPQFDDVLSWWNGLSLEEATDRLVGETPPLSGPAAKELRRIRDQRSRSPQALQGPVERLFLDVGVCSDQAGAD